MAAERNVWGFISVIHGRSRVSLLSVADESPQELGCVVSDFSVQNTSLGELSCPGPAPSRSSHLQQPWLPSMEGNKLQREYFLDVEQIVL